MTKLITCAALVCFTRYVSGFGMIHGDPDNKEAKKVDIPDHKVAEWHEEGLIKAPKAFLDELKAASEAEAADVAQAELDARIAQEQAAAAAAAETGAADDDGAPPA